MLVGAAAAVAVSAMVVARADLPRLGFLGAAYLLSALGSSLLGLYILVFTYARYFHIHKDLAVQLWMVAVAALVTAVASFGIRALAPRLSRPGVMDRVTGVMDRMRGVPWRRCVGAGLGIAVPVAFAVLVSRPLWWHGHGVPRGSNSFKGVERWQAQIGQPIDGSRSYDELTMHWVAWYFGWAMVALAAVGLGLLAWRAVVRSTVEGLVLLVPTAVVAALYLNKVSVTPDQVWAYRRLLPIFTPGLLVGAVYAVEWWLQHASGRLMRTGVAVAAVVLLGGWPLLTWNSLMRVPEQDGTLRLVTRLCDRLGDGPVLLAAGNIPGNFAPTVKVVCGNDVVAGSVTKRRDLRRFGGRVKDLQVVTFSTKDVPPRSRLGEPDAQGTIRTWGHTLLGLPDSYDEVTWHIWVGRVERGRFVQE